MNHRHLLPEEIDLLVDDEVGFGVAPLKAHVHCGECRARLDEAQTVVNAMERLPHIAPSHDFASRVMSQVPVFVPWHVTAQDTVRQWLPQSRPARLAVLAFSTAATSVLSVALLWLASQTDVLVFATGVGGDRLREFLTSLGNQVIATVFGAELFAAVQRTGSFGIALALLAMLGAGVGALATLRAVALASSRRRA